jgi:hypothetical protein
LKIINGPLRVWGKLHVGLRYYGLELDFALVSVTPTEEINIETL